MNCDPISLKYTRGAGLLDLINMRTNNLEQNKAQKGFGRLRVRKHVQYYYFQI